jgi:hypothetical protein
VICTDGLRIARPCLRGAAQVGRTATALVRIDQVSLDMSEVQCEVAKTGADDLLDACAEKLGAID